MRVARGATRVLAVVVVACMAFASQACRSTSPVASAAHAATPQPVPLDHLPALRGGYFRHRSQAVGRDFHVYIRLPEDYGAAPAKRYPVVYLLDGDSLFPMLAPAHLFLAYDEKLPEAIVVGIAYGGFDRSINKRHVDFSAPAADATRDHPHGAPEFLRFLQQELLPTIESRYRVDASRRVLLGQSRAGYFILWSALEAPDLFWGRIASNPSSTPGRERLFAEVAPHRRGDLSVAVAIGDRDTDARKRFAREWTEHWQSRQDAPWQVVPMPIEGGTHAASIGEVYRQAMLWLFRDEIPPESGASGAEH